MATSGKPTALHISLILSVMLTIIMGVVAYLYYRDYSELDVTHQSVAADLRTKETALNNLYNDLGTLKDLIGHQLEEIGERGSTDVNTVAGAMESDMQQYGGELAQTSLHDTLVRLRQELDTLIKERNSIRAQLSDTEDTMLALREQYQSTVDQHQRAAADAETRLTAQIAVHQEAIDQKNSEIDQLRREKSDLTLEHERILADLRSQIAQKEAEYTQLAEINNQIRDKLDQVTRHSFEVADGEIRWVDHNSRLVTINLGSSDKLQTRTTFSVYRKTNQGIGRGAEDIKGAIEVTRILGPHLAEAKFVDADIYSPIAKGDPIYTPVWSPNQTLHFTLAGIIDLDGDGRSDRERLHNIIEAAGGRVDNEVDDNGNVTGDGIDVNTKFLVVGELPNPGDANVNEREAVQKIQRAYQVFEDQARRQGVRTVNLSEFLDYMGYTTKRRLYVPGEGMPYTLKSGSLSPSVDETLSGRESSGQASGVFNSRGRLQQPTSSGQTSKLFGGGR